MTIPTRPETIFDVEIADDDVESYDRDGYLVVDRVTTDEEIDWIAGVYDELYALPRTGLLDSVFDPSRPYGTLDEPELGQLLRPELRNPELTATTLWANARKIASRLTRLPFEEIENWGHFVHKPATKGRVTPWHQDEAYWDPDFDYHAIAAWAPLDDVTIDNGCLWFVPGSHKSPILSHRNQDDDPSVHVLVAEGPDTSAAVPVPMRRGGMSFHHPRMLHYSRPNTTDRPRRAYANEFQSAPIKRQVRAERPWIDEGRAAMAKVATSRSSS
jgi:hypothetical protein